MFRFLFRNVITFNNIKFKNIYSNRLFLLSGIFITYNVYNENIAFEKLRTYLCNLNHLRYTYAEESCCNLDDKHKDFELTNETIKKIKNEIDSYEVVLFMKGTARNPSCKYSRYALELLKASRFETIHTVNVLDDPDLRNGLKVYSKYNNFPQLYIKGNFIGGLDKIIELYNSNKLKSTLDN